MPDYFAYPSAEDVEAKLKSMAFWPEDGETTKIALAREQAELGADAARDEWEELTGWIPYLSVSDIATTRYFDRTDQRGYLNLEGGLLRLDSVSVGGTAYTITGDSRQVWTHPANALSGGDPFTELYFGGASGYGTAFATRPQAIAVAGRWGRTTMLRASDWRHILDRAALIALIGTENPRDVANLGHDGFNIAWDPVGPIDPKTVLNTLGKDFEKVAARRARVII